ncbi:hypothetical protein O1M54_07830 [Streptomyces diastatochromogenes]|nr:hypothetical protein [Streptomyces diastatochromogenes]
MAFCDRNRLNHRFREGYHLIRVIDTMTGAEKRHLPDAHQSLSDRVAAGPVWSPDGRWMALVAESALWLLPVGADGTPTGPARRLTDEPADHPSWSGDAHTLLYLSCGRLRLMSLGSTADGVRTLSAGLTNRPATAERQERLRIHAGQLWDGTGAAPARTSTSSSAAPASPPSNPTAPAARVTAPSTPPARPSSPACSTATPTPTTPPTAAGRA